MRHETEKIYDEQMAPLVARLIEVAETHDLPMVVSVGMVLDGDEGMCTTMLPTSRPELQGDTMATLQRVRTLIVPGSLCRRGFPARER